MLTAGENYFVTKANDDKRADLSQWKNVMTEKVFPKALILNDFEFKESEIAHLQTAADVIFTQENVLELTLVFGSYLSASVLWSHAATPKLAGEVLEKTRNALVKLTNMFKKFFGDNGSDTLVVGGIGLLLNELSDFPLMEQRKIGRYVPSDTNTGHDIDQHLAAGNLIDRQLALYQSDLDEEEQIDLAYIFGILRIMLDSVNEIKKNIKSSGGNTGDPYFTIFLIDLLNVICPASGRGPYHSKTIDFVDAARQIVADRLKGIGEKAAYDTVSKLKKDNMVRRVQVAFAEDAKTYRRSRVRDSVSPSQEADQKAGDQRQELDRGPITEK